MAIFGCASFMIRVLTRMARGVECQLAFITTTMSNGSMGLGGGGKELSQEGVIGCGQRQSGFMEMLLQLIPWK